MYLFSANPPPSGLEKKELHNFTREALEMKNAIHGGKVQTLTVSVCCHVVTGACGV